MAPAFKTITRKAWIVVRPDGRLFRKTNGHPSGSFTRRAIGLIHYPAGCRIEPCEVVIRPRRKRAGRTS